MIKVLEKHLKEFGKSKTISEIDQNRKDIYINSILNVLGKIGRYFNIKESDFLKKIRKSEMIFLCKLCQYQIIEENKKIFNDSEIWNLTARLFKWNPSNVMNAYYEIENFKESPTPKGKKIREVLELFSGDSSVNLKQEKFGTKANPLMVKQFSKIAKEVCGKISAYFNMNQQDLFKNKNSLEIQMCFYKISEENKRFFDCENYSLTADLFNVDYESVICGHYQIDFLKDQNNLEGKIIRGTLSLFKENP